MKEFNADTIYASVQRHCPHIVVTLQAVLDGKPGSIATLRTEITAYCRQANSDDAEQVSVTASLLGLFTEVVGNALDWSDEEKSTFLERFAAECHIRIHWRQES